MEPKRYLGIDPGRDKCGLVVMTEEEKILQKDIVTLEGLASILDNLFKKYQPAGVVLGDGTGSEMVRKIIRNISEDIPVYIIDEKDTTLKARSLYFKANPPSGWRRLLPVSLQTPPEAVDDWAAVAILKKFFEKNRS